eukprot:TRINITY_DN29998_c0_g1_i1.p1 TRINITY_DN29998_c0_g1~~TRINITY_DN29998_c0_g1_i1.p1  ORF type:complete len:435 (+),score=65.96 TRINITY_DN29998_c0_g1_i1:22-1305(+)
MGLPLPLGPFHVAFADFELRRSPGETVEKVEGEVHPPLVRFYYPTDQVLGRTTPTAHRYWLPDIQYAFGYSAKAMPPLTPMSTYRCWLAAGVTYPIINTNAIIQATVASPLLKRPPSSTDEAGEPKEGQHKWPVVLFSHGLWTMRTAYSTFCCDLASHGYVVVAVEHGDGSACMARSTLPDGTVRWMQHDPLHLEMGEVSNSVRIRQLDHRVLELKSILRLLDRLSAGDIPVSANAITGPPALRPSSFVGALDMSHVGMAGHSFGGITSVLMGEREERVKCVMVLDGWWTPLIEEGYSGAAGGRPLLLVDNSDFTGIRLENARAQFLATAKAAGRTLRMIVIQGSKHQDQCDLPLMMPWIAKKMGMTGEGGGLIARGITSRACLIHLAEHLLGNGRKACYDVELTEFDLRNFLLKEDIRSAYSSSLA